MAKPTKEEQAQIEKLVQSAENPTALRANFAPWIVDKTGQFKGSEDFDSGVRYALAFLPTYQASPELAAIKGEHKSAKESAAEERRAAAAERKAKAAAAKDEVAAKRAEKGTAPAKKAPAKKAAVKPPAKKVGPPVKRGKPVGKAAEAGF